MKSELRYVECKTGFNHDGPAWIGRVIFSKSGQTVYFNGRAFRRRAGVQGNFFDLDNGDEYWISGIKKDMADRHRFGAGKVMVERSAIAEYLKAIEKSSLSTTIHEVVDIDAPSPVARIHEMENRRFDC